ncbi:hypothetical protein ACN4EG_06810 [Alkalinema pantanalense CENA528]|uniref:hypothetical protein n=1 Tax=Alkalinema pantanalense TaxID=1620705 RepID=UPI003D6E7508
MEPITTATIVTLVLTKAIEKNGEKITEAVWTVAGKLLTKLKEKMPLTGMKLEQVQTNPALMESHPKDFGVEVLEGEIVEAVKDGEVLALAEAVAQAVKAEGITVRRMVVLSDVQAEESIVVGKVQQESTGGEAAEQVVAEKVKAKSIQIGDVTQKQSL